MKVEVTLFDTCNEWAKLRWTTVAARENAGCNLPFKRVEIPKEPGLYRLTWHNKETWKQVKKEIEAKATKSIKNNRVAFEVLEPPVVLSIGKTTKLRNRLAQHFGNNKNNNRILARLRQILPGKSDDEIRELGRTSITLEVVVVKCWVLRCQLERFGAAIQHPILDFDAEH
ncbi:MAG: hypothetical protein KatS3mg105_2203 [Gemmatales bacterium]|nr:MAG: hypothetical protein KatS3mg105_2203 [Gemmatales bacterium]